MQKKNYLNWTAESHLSDGGCRSTRRATNGFFSLLLFVFVAVFTLSASVTIAQIEVDGNAHQEAMEDWANVYNNTSTASVTTGILPDGGGTVLTVPEDSYIGGGTKDDNDFSSWEWEYTSVSDKTDILNGGAALYGSKIFFFGDRFSNDGATNIGFWFLQDEIELIPPVGTTKGQFDGSHQIGDILVVAEISQGGVVGNAAAYRWVGPGNGTVPNDTKSLVPLTINAASLFSIVNSDQITVPWDYVGKQGLPNGQVPAVAFFEGYIDLAALNLTTNACFSSFIVETRASFSVSSILEDFLLGSFNVRPEVSVNNAQMCQEQGAQTILTANVSGGVGPLTYEWSTTNGNIVGPTNTASITVNQAGTYQVVVYGKSVDGTGLCASAPAVGVVTYYPTPSVNAVATPVQCFGDSDGTIVATGSGGSGGNYQYKLNAGSYQQSGTFTDLAPGLYTITVQDGNGCTATTQATVLPATQLSVSASPTPVLCNDDDGPSNDGTVTLTIISAGAGSLTYAWTGPEGFNSTSQNLTGLAAGEYNVLVTDANGCSTNASATVLPATLLDVSALATPVLCNDDDGPSNDGTVTLTIVSAGAGSLTFAWTGPNGFNSTSQNLTALAAGVYNVTVTDANGCTATASATVLPATLLDVSALATPVLCNDDDGPSNDGTVTLTIISAGAGSLTYAWTGPNGFNSTSQNLTALAAGVYNVTVTDANGCTATASATVLPATLLDVSALATPVTCSDDDGPSNDGTVTLTIISAGAGSLTFAWTGPNGFNSTSQSLTALAAGVYNVTVTDANGCTATASATVLPATLLDVSALATPVLCNDDDGPSNDGTVTLTIISAGAGSLTFAWTGPNGFNSTSQNLSALAAGVYNVTVTDANGCTATASATVLPATLLDVSALATPVLCNDDDGPSNDGTVTLTIISAGAGSLTFAWTGPNGFNSTSQNLSALAAGVYNVTVTDANGCTATASATVLPATLLDVSALATPVLCNDDDGPSNDGTVTLTIISAGAGSLTFAWTGPNGFNSTSQNLSALAAGVYNVTVTDANGCTATASATVLPATLLDVSALATPVLCNDDDGPSNDGTVTLTIISAGAGSLTFAWTGPNGFNSTSQNLSALAAGVYNVTVTDANGCTATASATVLPATLLDVSALATPVLCNDDDGPSNDGTVTLTIISAGAGSLTFAWTGPNGFNSTSQNLTALAAGVYNVTVTDANGCTATASATVLPATLLDVSALATPVLCNDGDGPSNDGTVTLTIISAGAGSLTFAWTGPNGFNSTSQSLTALAAGVYNVTVTDANGCTATASATVLPATLIEVSISASVDCTDGPDGLPSGTVSVTGSGYSKLELYDANTNVKIAEQSTTQAYDFTGLASGSYYVIAFAANSLGVANACSAQSDAAIVEECYWFEIEKVTQGIVDPTRDWNFKIYEGPDGFGTTPVASDGTLGDADGILDFNFVNLDPTKTYTVCEENMAAGWSAVWVTDSNGNSTVLMTYNPNADDIPSQDLGNRCFDIGAGTDYPLVTNGIFSIHVDNTYPGGSARTPGYWKNWNTCSGGGQAANAARNGGWQAGYWLLDDVLASPGVTLGTKTVLTCAEGVKILDQRDLKTGKKMASDAAYTLAMHLLAFKLNQAAGAYSCPAANDAAMKADALLIQIKYNGSGAYLKSSNPLYAKALQLAKLLDNYNNNILSSSDCSIVAMAAIEDDVEFKAETSVITDTYPNPFEQQTKIRFMLPEASKTTVEVVNTTGVRVKVLFNEYAEANRWYEVDFEPGTLAKQLFIYRIVTDKGVVTGKLLQK